ncbi:ribosome maturation factor RimM [Tessaracoccus flavus]|jgi:16S rRNA processing protein RimM|uniref:Ribosome maturation factor RimM n=1 Tax=Tessaracoccus flavus TaxID=1610493 RepID=A0A1Q2CFK0_9ACTN|nr:ribosome maturation factor RimM [Tessaracoccus flavus]AQP44840.1 ribosome maturation factor RimM [Tessaracoccus flavus]SDY96804.1 16S rRNA processing protein RimM [Tessaracoccus flavus]
MSDLVEVTIGRVGRAHGIRGDVFVDVRTDEPARRFRQGATVAVGEGRKPIELATVKWNRGKLIVSFTGFPDRTAVETLTGELLRVRVPADERPSEPEEYFDRQLVGLAVHDHADRRVGVIAEVLHLPAQDVLRVDTGADDDRLVPFVSALVPVVDLDAGLVRLADVVGLLEDQE